MVEPLELEPLDGAGAGTGAPAAREPVPGPVMGTRSNFTDNATNQELTVKINHRC